jgi:hypothetical protein
MATNDFYNRDDAQFTSLPGFRDYDNATPDVVADFLDEYVLHVEAGSAGEDSQMMRAMARWWLEQRYHDVPMQMQNAVRRLVDAHPLRNKYVRWLDGTIVRLRHDSFVRLRDAGLLDCEGNAREYVYVGLSGYDEMLDARRQAEELGRTRFQGLLTTEPVFEPVARSVAKAIGLVAAVATEDEDWEKMLEGMEDEHDTAARPVRPLQPLELVAPRAGEDFFAAAKVWAAVSGPRVMARRRHVGAVLRTIYGATITCISDFGRATLSRDGHEPEEVDRYVESLAQLEERYQDELCLLDGVLGRMFVSQVAVRPESFDLSAILGRVCKAIKDPLVSLWKMLDDLWIDHPLTTELVMSLTFCFLLGLLLGRLPPCRATTVVRLATSAFLYLYLEYRQVKARDQRAFIEHMEQRRAGREEQRTREQEKKDEAFRRKHGMSCQVWEYMEDLKDELEDCEDPEPGKVEPQSLGTGLLATAVMAVFFRRVPAFVKIVNAKKFEDGVSAMLTGSVGAFETLLNLVLRSLGKKEISILKSHNIMVDQWRDASVAFAHRVSTGAVDPGTPTAVGVYEQLRDQGITYQATHKVGDAQRTVKVGMDALARVAGYFPNTGACRGRMEPLALCLTGEAGCGKSELARLLSFDFVHKCCADEEKQAMAGPGGAVDYNRMVFQKGASEYWEGYCGQPVCVMDDFLQALPVPGPDTEVAAFIRAVNQWPYPLNMATLELKGKFFFKSKLVLVTTNVKNLSSTQKVIACEDAVARRFSHSYKVVPSHKYTTADGRLDVSYKSVIDTSGPGGGLDEVWDFYEHNLLTGVTSAIPIKYSTVQARMTTDYARRVAIEQTNVEFLNARVTAQGLGSVVATAALAVGAAELLVRTARRAGAALVAGARGEASKSCASLPVKGLVAAAAVAGIVVAVRAVKFAVKTLLQAVGLWRKDKVCAQGAAMSSQDEVVARIRANGVHVYARGQRLGHGVMLTSRILMVPRHYALQCGTHELEVCSRLGKRLALVQGGALPTIAEDKDCACYAVDRQVDGMADIRGHFWDPGCKYTTDRAFMVNTEVCSNTRIAGWPQLRNYDRLDMRSTLTHHTARTSIGDCGSLIINADPKARKRVMGMHAAGDYSGGFYVPISCKELTAVTAQAHLGFEELGKVGALFNSGDTAFVKTPYSGYFAPITGAPAALRPVDVGGVRVDPMVKAVEATNRDFSKCHLPEDLPDVVDHLVGEIFSFFDGDPLEQLTYEQAVAGVPGEPYIRGIARAKSMGYPGCTKYHNKRPAFGAEGDYTFDGEAAEYVKDLHDQLLDGYRRGEKGAVFRDVLKDEIRSFAKVESADTRLISASPVQYTILCRRVFARYTAAFMRTRLQHGGLVGINPFSREWTHVYDSLKNKNADGSAASGDYKQFDKSQHQQMLRLLLKAVARRLPAGELDAGVVNMIIEDTVRSVHLGGDSYRSDTMYQTEGSLPSGHPMTSVLNSMYNMLIFRLVWRDSAPGREYWNFRENVQLYVFGDDNLFAPNDANISFGLDTMAAGVGKYGMVYTSEEKDGPLYHLKPVGRCGFLKRGFGVEPDYVYAPLEEASICDMFNWQRRKTPEDVHLSQVAQAALMEYSAHEFSKFEQFLDKLRPLLKAHGVCDPTYGVEAPAAYRRQRCIYRQNTPEWSVE